MIQSNLVNFWEAKSKLKTISDFTSVCLSVSWCVRLSVTLFLITSIGPETLSTWYCAKQSQAEYNQTWCWVR